MGLNRTITLTTDFGTESPYVAEMKGAILCVAPEVRIIDATHCVEAQNVAQGAFYLRQFADAFPRGTIHVAVVDPGVGTNREILLVECREQYFVAPNNGLLTFPLEDASLIRQATEGDFWRDVVSSTFHGRDIMGPVAAHLANGEPVERLTSAFMGEPVRIPVACPAKQNPAAGQQGSHEEWLGEIVYADSFGNLISNLPIDIVTQDVSEVIFENAVVPFVRTYGEIPLRDVDHEGSEPLISLVGSSGWLEIAIKNGNAANAIEGSIGKSVRVRIRPKN